MGCWCETCGISGLAINAGDKVRVFLIVRSDYDQEGGGSCYAHEVWYPRGLPIKGEYNDYGGLEDDSIVMDASTKILLEGLKKDWVNYEPKHEWDDKLTADELDLGRVIDMAAQSKTKIYDGESPTERKLWDKHFEDMSKNPSKLLEEIDFSNHAEDRIKHALGIMFVLEDVYQAMIKFDPTEAKHDDQGWLYIPYRQIIDSDAELWYKQNSKTLKSLGDTAVMKRFGPILMDTNSWRNAFSVARLDPPFCKGFSYYTEALQKFMQQELPYEDENVQSVLNDLKEYMLFSNAMIRARRAWMPQTGKGSQDNDSDIHKILANAVIAICEAREAEEAQWRDEDEEEYYAKHNEEELAKRAKNAKESK